MLGLTSSDLLAHEKIQELLTKHSQQAITLDTLFESNHNNGSSTMHKVNNLQVLLESTATKEHNQKLRAQEDAQPAILLNSRQDG